MLLRLDSRPSTPLPTLLNSRGNAPTMTCSILIHSVGLSPTSQSSLLLLRQLEVPSILALVPPPTLFHHPSLLTVPPLSPPFPFVPQGFDPSSCRNFFFPHQWVRVTGRTFGGGWDVPWRTLVRRRRGSLSAPLVLTPRGS